MVCPLSSPLDKPKHTAFKLPPGNCVHAAFSPRTLIMANHHCISSCSLLANCALEWPVTWWGKLLVMSTFSPISSQSSNGMKMHMCVCLLSIHLELTCRPVHHRSLSSILIQRSYELIGSRHLHFAAASELKRLAAGCYFFRCIWKSQVVADEQLARSEIPEAE